MHGDHALRRVLLLQGLCLGGHVMLLILSTELLMRVPTSDVWIDSVDLLLLLLHINVLIWHPGHILIVRVHLHSRILLHLVT